MQIKVNRLQSLDRSQIATNVQEQESLLNSLGKGDLLVIEAKQTVKNKAVVPDLTNLSFRLLNHEKAIPQKEELSSLAWITLTKSAFEKFGINVGDNLSGYYLETEYIPFSELTEQRGLDADNNVVIEPIIDPNANQILLYETPVKVHPDDDKTVTKLVPMGRLTHLRVGKYPGETKKPKFSIKIPNFDGQLKLSNGRKTDEYKAFLNNLYSEYQFQNIVAKKQLEVLVPQ